MRYFKLFRYICLKMDGEGEGEGSNSRMGEQYKWEPNPYLAAMVRMSLRMVLSFFLGWCIDRDNCADSRGLFHLLPHIQEQ